MCKNINRGQILGNDKDQNIVTPNYREHTKKLDKNIFLFFGKHIEQPVDSIQADNKDKGKLEVIDNFQFIIF